MFRFHKFPKSIINQNIGKNAYNTSKCFNRIQANKLLRCDSTFLNNRFYSSIEWNNQLLISNFMNHSNIVTKQNSIKYQKRRFSTLNKLFSFKQNTSDVYSLQKRNYSLLKRIKSFFSDNEIPIPPKDISTLRDLELIGTRKYIENEVQYFQNWNFSPKLRRIRTSVDEYFSALSSIQNDMEGMDMVIRDGYLYIMLASDENLLFRMKFEGNIPTNKEIKTKYESKDKDLHVLLSHEILEKYHGEWFQKFGDNSGVYTVLSVAYKNNLLAYSLQLDREENRCAVFIRDVVTGELLDEIYPESTHYIPNEKRIKNSLDLNNITINSYASLEIVELPSKEENGSSNNKNESKQKYILFYALVDDRLRPFAAARHQIGNESKDELLFIETNESIFVDIRKTSDEKFVTFYSGTNHDTEVSIISSENALGPIQRISKRVKGLRYYVEHSNGNLYIFTNVNDGDLSVMRTTVNNPGRENWKSFAMLDEGQIISEVDIYNKYLVLYESIFGENRIRIVDTETETSKIVPIPVPYGKIAPSITPDFYSPFAFFSGSSIVCPNKHFKLSLSDGNLDYYSTQEKVPFFDENNFKIYRIEVASTHDPSIKIPVTIAHQKRLDPSKGNNHIIIEGYGAYRENFFKSYSHNMAILLNKGYIIAFTHCRGGGELGQKWYDDGRVLHKKNTFNDFVDCASYFVENGWATPKQITARGTSAGALTVAVAANMRPDLFGTLVLHIPFLDLIEIMCDPTLPMTVAEYEEFGDPNIEEIYQYMKSYAPIEKLNESIQKNNYFPNVYLTAGLNDVNTPCWNTFKYVAHLRKCLKNAGLEDKVKVFLNFDEEKQHTEYPTSVEGMKEGIRSEIEFISWSEKNLFQENNNSK